MSKFASRPTLILLIGATALTGCAQIGGVAGDIWGGTKSVASWVASPVTSLLRDTPDTEYAFAAEEATTEDAEVVTYASTTSPYAGGTVELYTQPSFTTTPQTVSSASGTYYGDAASVTSTTADPVESISFVRLNGESPSMADWQSCETSSRGYWLVDMDGGRLNPQFEVCMRNRGYVLEAERASYGDTALAGGYAPTP